MADDTPDKNNSNNGNRKRKTISEDQFRVLKEKVDSLQRSIDVITSDMDQDRKYLQDFVVRLGSVESTLAELLKSQKHQANRIADQVEDAVEPMTDEVTQELKGLKNIINAKKVIAFRNKGGGILRFLFFWRKG